MKRRVKSLMLALTMMVVMMAAAVPALAAPSNPLCTITIHANKTNANPGDEITYTISMQQTDTMTAFGFNIVVPSGLSYVKGSGKTGTTAKNLLGSTFSFEPDSGRLLSWYSSSGSDLKNHDKIELLQFKCKVNSTAGIGKKYTVTLSNVETIGGSTQSYNSIYDKTSVVTAGVNVKAPQKIAAKISASSVTIGKTAKITVQDPDKLRGAIKYTSSNSKIAAVSSSGTVTGKAAGTATITVSAAGDSSYDPASTKITVMVKKIANSITASNVTKYASATKTQTFSLGAKAKGGKLSYKSDNSKVTVNSSGQVTIAKNYAGTAKITITTAGDSTYGTATKTITVTVNQISNTITASGFTKTYSTKNQTFSIGAKRNGSGKVTYASSSKSVTVSSTGSVTVAAKYMGKATITIKVAASGIYKAASKTITVTVLPTKTALSGAANVTGLKMTVKWAKNTVGTGYQIQYSTDKNFKTGVKTVTVKSNSTVSTTVSELIKGKTYYVRIRTYKTVSGTNYYSGWSTAKSVKIVK